MFTDFSKAVQARYNQMAKGELFTVASDDLFDVYLAAFPPETNPLYKTRTVHDCQCCKQFVRRLGRVVAFDPDIVTIWGVWRELPEPFKTVAYQMNETVRVRPITGVFRTSEKKYGIDHNYGEGDVRHDHFEGIIAAGHYSLTPEKDIGNENSTFQVLHRGLTELRLADFDEVLALIAENGLYRGGETKAAIEGFRNLWVKGRQIEVPTEQSIRNFVWANLKNPFARFRSTAIGQLFVELAEGKPFEIAVAAYEKMVAPENYKRTSAPITTKMVENAVQKLTDLGLHGAMQRRYAKMTDVSVADVLFVDNATQMKDNITELLASSVRTPTPNLKHATPISDIREVIQGTKAMSLFLENRHQGNFVSITGGDGPERMFKWDNNFAWSYDGDVTDSVKQRVKAAGGKIDCKLRVSLSWYNFDDLDLHCMTPTKDHIYFGAKGGVLDVDMNAHGPKSRNAVENLAFQSLRDGVYKVWVNQYQRRESEDVGFAIEIEYDGVLHQYSYPKMVKDNVACFDLNIKNGKLESIFAEDTLAGGNVGKEKWGVKTESLVPVSAIMYSPNHWGNNAVGAKHTIFALKDCRNPDPTRGIYNEYLRNDLNEHRKVFEILGAKTKCPPTTEQISGVGFSAARGDSVTVVVNGRPYLVTF